MATIEDTELHLCRKEVTTRMREGDLIESPRP